MRFIPRDQLGWILLPALIGIPIVALTVWIYGTTNPSNVEIGLLQVVFLTIGVATSFAGGRRSIRSGVLEAVRPHGTKSIRRIRNLGMGISTFGRVIDRAKEDVYDATDPSTGAVSADRVHATFDTLKILIERELETAADALSDWQDVIPDELQTLKDEQDRGETP